MTHTGPGETGIPEQAAGAWRQLQSAFGDPQTAETFRPLARHAPRAFAGYVALRSAATEPPPGGSLPTATKELIMLAALCMGRKSNPAPVLHVQKAMQAGASVADIAEMVALVLTVGGMITYQSTGRALIEAAEEFDRSLHGASGGPSA